MSTETTKVNAAKTKSVSAEGPDLAAVSGDLAQQALQIPIGILQEVSKGLVAIASSLGNAAKGSGAAR